LVAFWNPSLDTSGTAWRTSYSLVTGSSRIICSRFVDDTKVVMVNVTDQWYAVLNYYVYLDNRAPRQIGAVITTTLYDPRKVYIFNNKIAVLAYSSNSDPGENQIWVADNPLEPVNPVLLDLPLRVFKVKIIYDYLFMLTNTDLRYTNDGINWKTILLPWLNNVGRNDSVGLFGFDNKIYIRFQDTEGFESGTFCASIFS
jgi:hypothetical protein